MFEKKSDKDFNETALSQVRRLERLEMALSNAVESSSTMAVKQILKKAQDFNLLNDLRANHISRAVALHSMGGTTDRRAVVEALAAATGDMSAKQARSWRQVGLVSAVNLKNIDMARLLMKHGAKPIDGLLTQCWKRKDAPMLRTLSKGRGQQVLYINKESRKPFSCEL